MLTEQINPNTQHIDRLSTLEMVRLINNEDRLVAGVVADTLPQIAAAIDAITARLREGGRLIYVGAGTSGRLGILDASECVPTFSVPAETIQGVIAGGEIAVTQSVEGAEDDRDAAQVDLAGVQVSARDAVVGIAASGRTPYVLAAVAYARAQGAVTVGVSCNVPAPLLDSVDIAISLPVGPEVITGSTRMKAGTAQKLVLNMLSTATMIKLGKVYGNLMVDVQVTNEKLAQRARRIISQVTGLDDGAAAALLVSAGNHVKTALVMHRLGVEREEAQSRLQAADGYLYRVIGA